ncbi:wax ester/triacylglycerol synthase domain-containing protein [Micromonospora sp. NPDC049559]|uniref:wax ester/triacylglycerol synthase domain-containing protein n=1 Tax=Micromonospora sp. NPDC049559 TaxID=3155923 RepID=UPI0034250FD9
MTLPPTASRPPPGRARPAASAPAPAPGVARRVLVVSADIGGGHHATGRALQERVQELWPGSQVRWLDTLRVMGPGVGPVFRRIYITNVEVTPWLYEFFYGTLWRHPGFARAAKAFTGAWAGRRLAPRIEAFDPDLILSTYPLGSAGLAWLRRRRGLGVPVGAWVSDFAPHPFWVYPQLDLNLVVHPRAVPVADAAAPGAPIAVCTPPVVRAFHPGDRAEARKRFGLDESRYVVVVACGTFGFGAVEEAVRGLAGLGDPVQVVVVCGHNERLAGRLATLGVPPERVSVLGWVEEMAELYRAADLVITNAGGATALEAWATGTPMLMYRPIAAHGAANAALMTAVGLTRTYQNLPDLVRAVGLARAAAPAGPGPAPDNGYLAELGLPALAGGATPSEPAAPAAVRGNGHGNGRAGAQPGRRAPSWPLRAPDAFFLHVQSATVTQQIGAVLDLDPRPDGRPVERRDVLELLAQRLPTVTTLRRRLADRGPLRRPGWVVVAQVDPAAHVEEHPLPAGAGEAEAGAAVSEFWSRPLPMHRPLWRMLLVTGLPGGRGRLAIKLHHSLGDGLSVIGTLQRLLDPAPRERGGPAARPAARQPETGPRAGILASAREGVRRGLAAARGLVRLAVAGPAPQAAFNRPLTTSRRTLVSATLPTTAVRGAARDCQAHTSELMCAVTAEAIRRTYRDVPMPPRLRAMFAVSLDPRGGPRTHGNWTGAVALDLPLEPMAPAERVARVRDSLRESLTSGEPLAAALVMRAMGTLPAPVHGLLARRAYNSRFVNVIVSYMSGVAHPQLMAGAPVRAVTPVVALADKVPIGVAVMRWGETISVGVLLDDSLAWSAETFVSELRAAFAELTVAD